MSTVAVVVAAVLLVALGTLALARPTVSLVTLVVLDVSNLNGVIADQLGTSPYKPQLALAILALLVLAIRGRFRMAWSPVLLGLLILYTGFCLSFLHAAAPAVSQGLLLGRARDLFYFLVLFALILSTQSLTLVVRVTVAALAALAGLTVVHEFVLHNAGDLFGLSRVPLVQQDGALTARHAGTSSDVNFWGRLLILFTPLSASLVAVARTWRSQMFWAGCTLSLLVGVYLTQSRGGFIAAFVALVSWLALAGGRYRRAILLLLGVLIVLVPVSGIGSRLLSLLSAAQGASTSGDPSVIERKRLQVDALHMFLAQPDFGHGIGSYVTLFPTYDRLSNAYRPVDIVVAAHNFYLEQAADGGVVLLLCWGIFFGTVLFAASRALRITGNALDPLSRMLSVGVISGALGWGVASLFLHLSDFRALLLLAAMAAVLDVRARQLAVPRLASSAPTRVGLPRAATLALGGVSVLAAGGIFAVFTHTAPTWTDTATLAVVPSSRIANGSTAYEVDVVSRGVIVPTLAEVLRESVTAASLERQAAAAGHAPVKVSVVQSRLGGSIILTVTGDGQQATADLGAAAVTVSKSTVTELNSSYQLTGNMNAPKRTEGVSSWAALPLAAVIVLSAMASIRGGHARRELAARRLARRIHIDG